MLRAVLTAIALLSMIAVAAPPEAYRAQITREAQFRFGIPAPVPVIAGQIQQESHWDARATSRVGASGLMQFMPATARWAGTAGALGASDPLNPVWAIRAGIWYDRFLYERVRHSTDDCDKWKFALSGYNGGEGWVRKRQRLSEQPGSWLETAFINPGIASSSQRENEQYPQRIVHTHQPKFAHWGRTVCLH